MKKEQRELLQGDIIICDLEKVIGSEQGGIRPCVIVSLDVSNEKSGNVIVVPITSEKKKWLPTHVTLKKEKYIFFEEKVNTVLCEGVRAISKKRTGMNIGKVDCSDLLTIIKAINYNFVFKDLC